MEELINSKINKNIPSHLKDFHYPLKVKEYSFLDHNSYVDCNRLKSIAKGKFMAGSCKPLGGIRKEDFQYILDAVRESDVPAE